MANSTSTLGVEFATKIIIVEEKRIRIQIWDTAGQERYKAITNSYYKNAKGGFIVYDITRRSSFNQVDKWYEEFKTIAGDDVYITLVGNKTDLKHIRAVEKSEAEEKAQKMGMDYIETSALNNTHINDAFHNITSSILSFI